MLISFPELAGRELASDGSTYAIYIWKNGIKLSFKKKRLKKFVAVIDFGIKRNILNILSSYGYEVVVFPVDFSINEILSSTRMVFFYQMDQKIHMQNFKIFRKFKCYKNFEKPVWNLSRSSDSITDI